MLAWSSGLTAEYRLGRWWRRRTVARAIRAARPDIILPDDERALDLLRRLYAGLRAADPDMAGVIARSLGNVADWPLDHVAGGAGEPRAALHVRAPATAVVTAPGR